ncbi:MAG: LacI family transcriptional regulator [Planctomycetes bacterium]|jgi:LacI family transcriptional regulator|nr:LacI family transcriptional regulator [Planctomycetota bacterium]
MAATMTEIAREAKVSVPLVSRFFNNDPTLRITPEKRERILQAKVKLGGIKGTRATRNLQKKLAYKISVPINRIFSPKWVRTNIVGDEKYRAIERTARAKGFRVSISFFDDNERFDFLKDLAPSQGYCDGFLLESGIINREIAEWLISNCIPHVSTDPSADEFGVNTVYDHVIGGIRQVVNHLLDLGHRRIGFFGTTHHYPMFVLAMTEKQMPFKDTDVHLLKMLEPGENLDCMTMHAREEFANWFSWKDCPTAFVCGNDHVALGVVDVLRSKGWAPGRDLSLIGWDNIEQRGEAPAEDPILTTVNVPFDVIGQRCAQRLLDQVLNGQQIITHERIPVELITRRSTGRPREN